MCYNMIVKNLKGEKIMNKKLLSGLMSVVMLAGSGATVGAHEVGKSKVSNNSVVRFVKNHKKIIAGILVVGAVAGVGYYKREEVKKGFNTAKDKVNSLIKSKPAERIEAEEKVESVKSVTGSETEAEAKAEAEAKSKAEAKAKAEAEAEAKAKAEAEAKAEAAKIRKDMKNLESKIKKVDQRINSSKGSLNSKNANNKKIKETINELKLQKSKLETELCHNEIELKK